ncbi:protein FAM13C-like, partial [Etheostoma cragini]|uniref:protein FAM13C-like n=1 Tax=Etheostoma cragini TaxID=417921 RepID=UPI00155EBDD2
MSGMFCFCLHGSLLKLPETEGDTSLRPSPEDGPPALGSKDQKSPCGPLELGGKDGRTLGLCHSVPVDENSPPDLLPVLSRCPSSPRHTPLTSVPPQQPPPPLLQLLGGGASPLPSPRCSSLSQRFDSDPDSAPSPPCSQPYMLCRGPDRVQGSEDPACPPSIPALTRHIQALKKRVRRFEDQFKQERNYKPSLDDKYSDPEMIGVTGELARARRQLKGTNSGWFLNASRL